VRSDPTRAARLASTYLFFDWWARLNQRIASQRAPVKWGEFSALAALGVLARLWAQTAPPTFDFNYWGTVADQLLAGGDPYSAGYIYGPTWVVAIEPLRAWLGSGDGFRLAIALILAFFDVCIAFLLARRGYWAGALLFMVLPVSIAISGQHGQIDNIAIAFALGAAYLAFRHTSMTGRIALVDVSVVILLGVSLSIKHIFVLLPIWLALKQGTWPRRIFYGAAPFVVLLLTVLPYLIADITTFNRAIGYANRGTLNAPFFYALLPDELVWGLINRGVITLVFLGILLAVGVFLRRLDPFDSTLAYAVSIVVFSTAIFDQYLSIPAAGTAAFLNLSFLMWLVFVSVYLLGEPTDLNVPGFNTAKLYMAPYDETTYRDQFVFLFVGWIIMMITLRRRISHGQQASRHISAASPAPNDVQGHQAPEQRLAEVAPHNGTP
jgi:hypothetical protein